jgi:putative Mg2+ transporter-C (MgtC) family protein
MVVSEYYHHLASFDPAYVRVDPGRIAAGAITGIGFIGAGVIVKAGVNVHGLTTAACLWIVAAIGLALGGGLYLAAATACVITLVSLWLLGKLERVMPTRFYRVFTVVTEGGVPRGREIVGGVEDLGLSVNGMDTEFDCSAGEHTYRMTVTMGDPRSAEELLSKVGQKPFVKRYSLHR